jgi:ABC-type polysaccharide/polyol phosphate transport system ATPase subunit
MTTELSRQPQNNELLKVESVWRRFRRCQRPPVSLKEGFVRFFQRGGLVYDDFWALRDISFTLTKGQNLGFCGGNGSGKSTLLRVLAGILPMSYGRVTVRGKLSTLLELGTGFLPDLTGRENIALNGAIMGMSDVDIARKADSIIEFAGLGSFIDSPIRTYSSGMYVRLAFSIAVHVDAEILLIDEILAVGDAEFQEKCSARLRQMRKQGTAMVIVSHSLGLLEELCDRVIWIDQGVMMAEGRPRDVLRQYSPSSTLHAI